jgi:L-ascorbate metabolism protein UlaG (beta-lactamase superfamily)
MKHLIINILIIISSTLLVQGQNQLQTDDFDTPSGKLTLTFIGHGSLMFEFNGKYIYIDPVSKYADYSNMPKASLILITHEHPDHFDTSAISKISQKSTQFIINSSVFNLLKNGNVMKNGEKKSIEGIEIEAVPAYNITKGRENFHPKGRDNGFILTLGNKRIYVAGDTENIPEMSDLKNIDIAFLPMNQPYTMLPAQVAEATQRFNPKILYPYHFGDTDVSVLQKLLSNDKKTEVRIRPLK